MKWLTVPLLLAALLTPSTARAACCALEWVQVIADAAPSVTLRHVGGYIEVATLEGAIPPQAWTIGACLHGDGHRGQKLRRLVRFVPARFCATARRGVGQ